MTPCSRSRCAPPATLGVRPSRSSFSSAVAAPPASWVMRVRLASSTKPGGSLMRKWPRRGVVKRQVEVEVVEREHARVGEAEAEAVQVVVRHVEYERCREDIDALVIIGEQGDVEAAVARRGARRGDA